jgi:hypothetical protein
MKTKNDLYFQLLKAEDAVLTMWNGDEVAVCFKCMHVPYIKRKNNKFVKCPKDEILVWSWTDDKLITLKYREVKEVTPLQSILNNSMEF